MTLRAREWPRVLTTSKHDLVRDLFEPALSSSIKYDRGVGFFSSGWLRVNSRGMVQFAQAGGQARWITSPILDEDDWAALVRGDEASREPLLKAALVATIGDLETSLEEDTRNALAWMIADGILEFRLAVPTQDLDGEFHDKFGVWTDAEGDSLSFNGSYNDSIQGLRNYESLKVFVSWKEDSEPWVESDQERFQLLWENRDPNVRVYELPEAAREKILKLRTRPRPYRQPRSETPASEERYSLWPHQAEALDVFLTNRNGVLEMATGTGKTRLALAACDRLIRQKEVKTIVIAADGTDLLDQWYLALLGLVRGQDPKWAIYRQYDRFKDAETFSLEPEFSIVLTSRFFLDSVLRSMPASIKANAILIHDEVHRLGSPSARTALAGLSNGFAFKLGLSATPERDYDQDGNDFIESDIGPVIFKFGLEEAIQAGILSPFEYHPISYLPSDEDTARVQSVYARKALREREGNPMPLEEVWTEIARVHKTSRAKLPPFTVFLLSNAELLQRCIVFVETKEYGEELLSIIHGYHHEFHTYYAEEDSETLRRFAVGELQCLVTCHRLSEGIDIQSLLTVFLFSSARARLETIQRIGRCLRVDPANPRKLAHVVDFVRSDSEDTADAERSRWLTALSQVRPRD